MSACGWNKVLIAVTLLVLTACKTIYIDEPDTEQKAEEQNPAEQTDPSAITVGLDVKISMHEQVDAEVYLKQNGISALYILEGTKLLYGMDSVHTGFCAPTLRLRRGKHVLTTIATRGSKLDYDAKLGWITATNSPYSYVARDTIDVRAGIENVPIVLRPKFAELVVDFEALRGDRLYITVDAYHALDVVTLEAEDKTIENKYWYDLMSEDAFEPARFLVTGEYTTDVKVYTKSVQDGMVACSERVFHDVVLREGEVTRLEYK